MRRDMAKVIVERPRYGSSLPSRKKGYRRFVQSMPLDELPRYEPLLGRWHGMSRDLNEHLGPLRRFLRSNVGRPWNKVHQELCEHVNFDNAVQKHVLTHVFQYVAKNCFIVGTRVFKRAAWRCGGRYPLSAGEMYVCPQTGLLKVVRTPKTAKPPQRIGLNPTTQYLHRDGSWWEVRVRKHPEDPANLWDVWLERPVARLTAADCSATYGGKLFAYSKRPLSPREVKAVLRHALARKK